MLRNRCWPHHFLTITAGDADGWCRELAGLIGPWATRWTTIDVKFNPCCSQDKPSCNKHDDKYRRLKLQFYTIVFNVLFYFLGVGTHAMGLLLHSPSHVPSLRQRETEMGKLRLYILTSFPWTQVNVWKGFSQVHSSYQSREILLGRRAADRGRKVHGRAAPDWEVLCLRPCWLICGSVGNLFSFDR